MSAYLLPIADREPLAWIVASQQTAFAEHRSADAQRLVVGDLLFLYTTRGCFRNPTRDRGRVVGRASVAAPARLLDSPVTFGSRSYPWLLELRIESLAPLRKGLELAPLVSRLPTTFPDPRSWSVRLRRALVPVAERDAALLERLLADQTTGYLDAVESYAELA